MSFESLLERGERIPKMPNDVNKMRPNVGDGVYVNPQRMLPERLVYGDVDFDLMEDVARRSLEAGATPPSAHRLATAAGWGEGVREAL